MHLSLKAGKILVKTKLDLACLCFWSQKFESKKSSTWRKKEINNNKNSTLKGSYVINECTDAVAPHSGYLGAPRSSGNVLCKNLHRQEDLSVHKSCACRDFFPRFLHQHTRCTFLVRFIPRAWPEMSLPYAFPGECLHATTFDNGFWCTFFRFLWILVHLPHQIDSNFAKTPRTGPSALLVLEVWGWVLTNNIQPSACSSSFDIEYEVRMFSRRSNLCSAVFPRACPNFFHFSAPLFYDTAPISKLDSGALFSTSSGFFSRRCEKSSSSVDRFSQWISNRKLQTIS